MEIIVAKSAGFCFGVDNAVKMTLGASGKIVTLGEIIHNDQVVNELKEKGIFPIESLDEYTSGSVVIRSHGVGESVYSELDSRQIEYIDATCPFVSRIHEIVKKASDNGKTIIITGVKTHAEVVGIEGWCSGNVIVVSSASEAEGLQLDDLDCVLVSQTTFSIDKYENIKNIIKNKCKTVEIFETICYTTRDRQREVISLATSCDTILVIGGKHSSNTLKLFDLAKEHCASSFLISSIDELSLDANKISRLGITAGASTPYELIMEVVKTMSETQVNSNELLNEAVAEVSANNEVNMDAVVAVAETNMGGMNEFLAAMEQEEKQVKPKEGKRVIVTVINATAAGINVNYAGKTDAHIDASEVELDEADYVPSNYVSGQKFEAEFIAKKSSKDVNIAMSRKSILQREIDIKKYEEIINGGDFTIKIDKAVKGGLLGKLGSVYTVFVPQSQIRLGFEKNPEKYVGKDLLVRKIDAKRDDSVKSNSRKIVASHSAILEEEKNAREEAFWATMIPDTIVSGKVKRFTAFGAFVSVNQNDCLAHISDLSWVKVNEPGEVLELNKYYDFLILNADRETGKVSLGYKQLQKKPYEEAMDKYPVGTVVMGKVERIFPYGAFVSIDRGVDGLVPVSEISYSYIKDASEAFTAGQEIEAKVIKFDGNKITLSVKALLPVPEGGVRAEVEITSEDVQANNERRAKANAKRFENIPSAPRKRSAKKMDIRDEESKSWTSESTGATMADLFKGLNFDFAPAVEEVAEVVVETPVVEAPVKVKKTAVKKVKEVVADDAEAPAKVKKTAAKKVKEVVADDAEAPAKVKKTAAKKVKEVVETTEAE